MLACAVAASFAAADFVLPEVPLASLQLDGEAATHRLLLAALSSDGLISITGVPLYAKARYDLLAALADCPALASDTGGVKMQDGSVRTSLFGEAAQPFVGLPTAADCPLFDAKLQVFRAVVDLVSHTVAQLLGRWLARWLARWLGDSI